MPADQLHDIVQRMVDAGESEDNIATVIHHFQAQEPAPVERGGLRHPLTSFIAPETEAIRSKLNDLTATPPGTPIMARSRTGTLYPSEIPPPGADVRAKYIARGAGEGVLQNVEGMTTPLAVVGGLLSRVPLAPVARTAATAIENVPMVRKVVPFADAAAGRLRTIAQGAQDAKMGVTRGAEMYQMPPRTSGSSAIAPAFEPMPEPPMPSHLDLSRPMRPSQMTEQQLAERMQSGIGTPAETRRVSSPPTLRERGVGNPSGGPSPEVGRLQTVAPIEPAPSHEPTAPASELTGPRVQIGADRVARQQGLTPTDVRTQAGPVLDETPGAPSPILPERALQSIIDKMKSLPRGGPEREAYVEAATSGKTKAQVENVRRTLEHLGLLVPAAMAAPSLRDELLKQMRDGVTGHGTAQ